MDWRQGETAEDDRETLARPRSCFRHALMAAFHPFLPLRIGAEWVWLRDRISPRANGSVDLRGRLDAAV